MLVNIILILRDSLLILPGSLRELALNLNVEKKGFFPYSFVYNIKVHLEYVGERPAFK